MKFLRPAAAFAVRLSAFLAAAPAFGQAEPEIVAATAKGGAADDATVSGAYTADRRPHDGHGRLEPSLVRSQSPQQGDP